MRQLSFDDLTLFVRVTLLGSLSAAARERDVPVSQVSRALSRIEKACGARLLHRSTHGLSPTAEGVTFLDYCQRIVAALESLEGDFADRARAPGGLVRVAASTVVARYLILPGLAALNERHPGLRVQLEVSDTLADLTRDGIDIAIRTAASLPDTMVARRIGTLGRALYAAPSYVRRAGLPATPADLHAHRLVTNSAATHLNDWPFVEPNRGAVVAADGFWRTNDTGMAAAMVLEGLGIGRLATIVAAPLVEQGLLVPVLPDAVDVHPVPIHAVTASARHRLPKVKACIDYWVESMAVRASRS